jgi:protein-tyrosine phosphatase
VAARILFLCTGNICRSPLAEVATRSIYEDESFTFSSAGTHAISDDTATATMQQVAVDLGLDLSHHRATALRECEQPEFMLGMEQHHLVAARAQFPKLDASRIRLLDHPNAVVDPYGLDLETYQETARQVIRSLQAIELDSFR